MTSADLHAALDDACALVTAVSARSDDTQILTSLIDGVVGDLYDGLEIPDDLRHATTARLERLRDRLWLLAFLAELATGQVTLDVLADTMPEENPHDPHGVMRQRTFVRAREMLGRALESDDSL